MKIIKRWWKVSLTVLLLATLEAILQYYVGSAELFMTMQLFNLVIGIGMALKEYSYISIWRGSNE